MKKRNGIGIFFILGITTLIVISVITKNNDKKQSPVISDNNSYYVRNGEIYENQMAFKGPIEVNNIPLTIVTAPPEVPAKAHITLGEQRKDSLLNFRDDGRKVDSYARDIFIHYPEKMILDDFRFNLKPGLKNLTRMDEFEELRALATMLEKRVFMRINDGALLSSDQLHNLVGFQTNFPNLDENIVLDLSLHEGNKFNSKEKIKFTIELSFKCTKKMIARKSKYEISLEKMMMHTPDTTNIIDTDIDTVRNFFVINCGE